MAGKPGRPRNRLVPVGPICEHGNRLKVYREVLEGCLYYDPGCKANEKGLRMRPHRAPMKEVQA